MSESHQAGPPYAPTTAGIGGRPTIDTDVPILSVLLVLYLGGAVGNMTILQLNNRKGHKFLLSALLFGFCMARILTCSLRIGAATHPSNISLSIAASIFVNAGILIVYIVDLLFAQRIMRARQPEIGWHPAFRVVFRILYGLIALALVLVIVFTVVSFYTLSEHVKQVARDVQLAAITYLLIVALLPLVMLGSTFALPKSQKAQHFGKGSMTAKALILATTATLCTIGAGFKAGANWEPPRPITNPAWYQKKAAFYVFFFVLEILIIYIFIITRVDQRFHIPDGSSKRKSFATELKHEQDSRPATSSTEGVGYASEETEKEPDV